MRERLAAMKDAQSKARREDFVLDITDYQMLRPKWLDSFY